MKEINDLKKQEVLESQNFLTDSIHLALRSCVCCLKNRTSWLSLDKTLKQEDEEEPVPKIDELYHMELGLNIEDIDK
jgi:hypothetical protein